MTTSQLPSHNHPHPNGGDWRYSSHRDISGRSGGWSINRASGNFYFNASNNGYGDITGESATGNRGSGQSHENRQPSKTAYLYKRTV